MYSETVIWSDGFENNAANRWTANGVWHIGSPTAGPATNTAGYRTHSGTNCASTQGYADSQDSRLICTNYDGANTLLVPPTNQYPRLRFWHWCNFGNALGYVEVSTDNGITWTRISPTYFDLNGGSVWSRPYLDLGTFAGQNIQIAFHFTSGGCCANALGWYVDDVAVVTSPDPPTLTFPESFEFDPEMSDWSVDAGTWEIGKPTSGPNAAHTGVNCAATVLAGNYVNNVDSRLISPPFLVPSNGPSLHFWQWCSFNNALGFVEINNGTIVTTVITNTTIKTNTTTSLNTNIYQLKGELNTDYSTPFYWNPTIGGWTNAIKAFGSAYDYGSGQYYFEGGSAPLASIGGTIAFDYRASTNSPVPQSPRPTNFIVWQGMTWNSRTNGLDNPFGYFGTNYTYTYTTNTTITTNQASWIQISQTNLNINTGGVWTNVSLDLSAYVGQTVRVAFHFTSGGVYTAPGWYVDDLTLTPSSQLVLGNAAVIANGWRSFKFSVNNYWTNSTWVVLASTNLTAAATNWLPIYTNQSSAGAVWFTDQLSTNFLQRYYRAVFP